MPHRSSSMNTEVVHEVAKSAPPVAVTLGALASGVAINHIMGLVTIVYVALQAGYLIWKWRRDVRRERERGGCAQ